MLCGYDAVRFIFERGVGFFINRGVSSIQQSEITASTRACAVFGQPIRHSASPAMHNAAMRELGLNWRYLGFEVAPVQLRQALEGCRAMRFAGVNLTVPHKILALDMMDALDETARNWGAVNTVAYEARMQDGSWKPLGQVDVTGPAEIRMVGYNTDADAIVRSLVDDLGCDPVGKRVVILGAGGAGRVAALRLAQAGVAGLWLVNRTRDKAAEVGEAIRKKFPAVSVQVGYPVAGEKVDLVLNATSLGLSATDVLPWDPAVFALGQARFAYDMIYRPAVTPFLAKAGESGLKTANGIGMLLYQGAKALEIWSGRNVPVDVMRRALVENVYGGGKT